MPSNTDVRWRVSVDLVHGTDFMIGFDNEDDPEKAAKDAVVAAHRTGFIANPVTGEIISMLMVKSIRAHEYEAISTPNPAGAGSPKARQYGGGNHPVNRRPR